MDHIDVFPSSLALTIQVPPPALPPSVEALIREWFSLVDDDGSGTLDRNELGAALKVWFAEVK